MATYLAILSYTLFDDLGVAVPHDVFVDIDDATTLASMITTFNAYAALLDPITDAASNQAHITIKFPAVGMKSSPNTGKAVDTTGLFTWSQSGSLYKASIDVAAIADAVLASGKIDLANTDIVAWVAWFAAAHSGVRGVSKFENNLTTFRGSVITTRKHRRSLAHKSTATT